MTKLIVDLPGDGAGGESMEARSELSIALSTATSFNTTPFMPSPGPMKIKSHLIDTQKTLYTISVAPTARPDHLRFWSRDVL